MSLPKSLNKMKSFKQFLDQNPDAESFLEMPIRIKASYFNPDSRTQVLFLQHALRDRTNTTNTTKPE
jgi:hypothetical protein